MSTIHSDARVGIDDIDLQASKRGLRVTLTVPGIVGPLTPAQVEYWREQVRLFDDSRLLLADVKRLVRALRTVPEDQRSPEQVEVLKRFVQFDTSEVQP